MAKKSHLTVEHLWQCERIGSPSLSPDGRLVVVDQTTYSMETNESTTQLWLYSTDGKLRKQLTSAGQKNTAPVWSPDGKWIAFCAKRGEGKSADTTSQLYVIAPDGGEARRVTSLSTGVGSVRWFPDSKRLMVISSVWPELKSDAAQAKRLQEEKDSKVQAKVVETDNYRYWDHWICDGRHPHLFEVSLATGKATDLFVNKSVGKSWTLALTDAGLADYAIAPDGSEIAWVQPTNPTRTVEPCVINLLDLKSRKLKTIEIRGQSLGTPVYAPSGNQLAFLAGFVDAPTRHTRLMVWSRKSGDAQRVLTKWPRSVGTYGAAQVEWAHDESGIYFNAEDSGQQHLYFTALTATQPKLIACGGTIAAFAVNRNGLAFTRASIDYPAQLIALAKTKEARLDRCNEFLAKIPLGKWESRTFKGWKGDDVQTFIVYPPGYEKADKKKKYPLLQNVHGGPHASHMDAFHFRWNMQAFAAQGYVVAAVNFHGSAGFDEKFLGALNGNMSEPSFVDIECVTDALIKEGIVDKARLYAAGGSYGGHMVAWMNGHTNRYKAMVCHAGVYDWQAQIGDDVYLWTKDELGAWPWEDAKKHGSQSPHTYAANFKTPTLVIHGELDYRVPYYEGLEYYNTMRARGIPARLVVFPDENHWVLKPQNSRLWYREFFAWLKRF
jgi:dipeptidyl aminopeptidase/acylaminoacyl peptidase